MLSKCKTERKKKDMVSKPFCFVLFLFTYIEIKLCLWKIFDPVTTVIGQNDRSFSAQLYHKIYIYVNSLKF